MMIIIHHSATEDDATPEEIAAINKQKLWDPYYKSDDPDPYLKGLEPHTGHSIGGKETFICYHHLVYWDGRVTTELQPLIYINGRWYIDMVVWHAGNMVVNCCSISICMVGNFDEKPPPASQIEAAQKLINYYKLFNPNVVVLPHRRIVDLRTDCPGNTWDQWGPLLEK
jgi:hypothetical protein